MTFVRFEQLPDGVVVLRDYRSLGATLVECHHPEEHRIWLARPRFYDALDPADHPLGFHDRPFCRLCRTMNPDRPVKMLAILPAPQSALF